jgi:hypothetical protein
MPKLPGIDLLLFRIGGPGLGNLLFNIFYAFEQSINYDKEFICPTIRQLKIGPFLRRESDKRFYGRLFRHRTFYELLMNIACRHRNWKLNAAMPEYLFRALDDKFSAHFRDLLISKMRKQTINTKVDIAIHIRLGDFQKPSFKSSYTFNDALPLEWFDIALKHTLQNIPFREQPTIVVYCSDACRDVERWCSINNLQLSQSSNALQAMLEMSYAQVIIPSISTFSLWSGFLSSAKMILPVQAKLECYLSQQMKQRTIKLVFGS